MNSTNTYEEHNDVECGDFSKILIFNNKTFDNPILSEYMKGRTKIYNLGSGPSFETVEPTDDNFIICQNHALLAQKKCDLFVFGDLAILQEPNLLPLLSNVKFILVHAPLHHWGPVEPEYDIPFIIRGTKKYFNGYYIFYSAYYNLKTYFEPHIKPLYMNLDINYYSDIVATTELTFPQGHIISTVFMFLCLFKYIKKNAIPTTKASYKKLTWIDETKYVVHYYGILGEKKGDEGRPYNEEIIKLRDPELLQYSSLFIKSKKALFSGTDLMLSFKTHILDLFNYYSKNIEFTLH